MSRFVFRLDPVLRLRERAERDAQHQLGTLLTARTQLEDELRRLTRLIEDGREAQRSDLIGQVRITAFREHAAATLRLRRQAEHLVQQLAALQPRIEAARAQLVERARERRALEVLRDRRFEEWQADMRKAEQLELDELAGRRRNTPC